MKINSQAKTEQLIDYVFLAKGRNVFVYFIENHYANLFEDEAPILKYQTVFYFLHEVEGLTASLSGPPMLIIRTEGSIEAIMYNKVESMVSITLAPFIPHSKHGEVFLENGFLTGNASYPFGSIALPKTL